LAGDSGVEEEALLRQLNHVLQLLRQCAEKMDRIARPRARNVLWKVLLPAGEFMAQKSAANECSALLLDANARLKDMAEVLSRQHHLLLPEIQNLCTLNLAEMADKLVELPPRAQYMTHQIDMLCEQVRATIAHVEKGSHSPSVKT